MSQNKDDFRYIVKNGVSFIVRIPRLNISRGFSFTVYGDEAHLCAIKYRDLILERERLGVLLHSQPRTVSKGGASTLAGVELKVELRSCGRGYDIAFSAYYKAVNGAYRRRSFSIRKYSYVGAFDLAVEWRVATSGLPIDPQSIDLPRPSLNQFIVLLQAGCNPPSPHMESM